MKFKRFIMNEFDDVNLHGSLSGRGVDRERIKKWLNRMNIKNYTINDDGTVDVDGGVDLEDKSLTSIPVQFGRVSGWFDCSINQLTSLKGAPREVGKNFWCFYNKKQFSVNYIRRVCKVRGIVHI